jgi:stage II sporulation protein D
MTQDVVVKLFQAKPAVRQVTVKGRCRLLFPESRTLAGDNFVVKASASGELQIMQLQVNSVGRSNGTACGAPLAVGRRLILSGADGVISLAESAQIKRSYRGEIVFRQTAAGFVEMTNKVSARDYITSVVGSETNPDFPDAELEAQAIMAQTMLARYKPGDPLSDTTEREAYLGAQYERPAVRQAVSNAWHKIIVYKGKPIQVYFHSTCAGGTSSGAAYFGLTPSTGYPYLIGRPCCYCRLSPFCSTKLTVIPKSVYARRFSTFIPKVLISDQQKRPLKIQVSANSGATGSTVAGFTYWAEVGQKLGWDKVPGTRFTVDADPQSSYVTFRSTGAGHGVGLCQWGAAGLARQGKTCDQILQFYFPGTSVQKFK